MASLYTAQRIAGTGNGWLVTINETGEKHNVFCHADRNTAEGAVSVLEETKLPRTE